MKLKITLNENSIKAAIKELEKYRDGLAAKNELFVNRLLDEGISVAKNNVSQGYAKYITFSKEVEGGTRTIGYLIAKDKPITVEWDYYGKKKTAQISPLLMSEFGSARFAEVLFDISGVGQGTFPGQTHAHESHWFYKEWDDSHKGEWKVGFGVKPTHPMYEADMEMIKQIERIAKEVFG